LLYPIKKGSPVYPAQEPHGLRKTETYNAETYAFLEGCTQGRNAFLPERNGIRPNTLHVLFDIVTVAILTDLAVLTT
jgi:hypothetical protein